MIESTEAGQFFLRSVTESYPQDAVLNNFLLENSFAWKLRSKTKVAHWNFFYTTFMFFDTYWKKKHLKPINCLFLEVAWNEIQLLYDFKMS